MAACLLSFAIGIGSGAVEKRNPLPLPGPRLPAYGTRDWRQAQGLPSDFVLDLAQTSDGYLWVATQKGLSRFNGSDFVPVSGKEYSCLVAPSGGGLWAIGDKDLVFFGAEGTRTFPLPVSHAGETVWRICEARGGGLWVLFPRGIYRFVGGRWDPFTLEVPATGGILTVLEGLDGTLWVGTLGGLLRISGGRASLLTRADGLPDDIVAAVHEDGDGTVWAGTGAGIARLEGGRFEATPWASGRPHAVREVMRDAQGTLWVATHGHGIWLVQGDAVVPFGLANPYEDEVVSSLLRDRQGNLWVGTLGMGLHQLWERRFANWNREGGLPLDLVNCLLELDDGSLWIGSLGGGLFRWKAGRWARFGASEGLGLDRVESLFKDVRGDLWVINDQGDAYRFGGRVFQQFFLPAEGKWPRQPRFTCFEGDGEGGLWIGTRIGLFHCASGGACRKLGPPEGLPNASIIAMARGSDGTLWVSTSAGLARVGRGGAEQKIPLGIDTGLEASAILSDGRGGVWLTAGTSGLARVSGGTLRWARRGSEGIAGMGQILTVDRGGSLWLTSPHGLMRIALPDLAAFLEGRSDRLPRAIYGPSDGVLASVPYPGSPAAILLRDGRIAIATLKGILIANGVSPTGEASPPPIFIEQVRIDDREIPAPDSPQLKPGRKKVELRFSALEFRAPEMVRYRYRMVGLEDRWIDGGNRREALYSSIPAGDFVFEVEAVGPSDLSLPGRARYPFSIPPHFYETIWFYALCGLVALLAGFGIQQARVLQARRRAIVLQGLVEERTRDLASRTDELAEANEAIRKEQQRSEDLLANILPRPIAERLKAGERTIADGFQEVSILFCDLVDFTRLSARTSARDVVDLLHEVVTAFDRLAAEVGLEKIKTIGDAYHAAAGIPVPQEDHARRAAEMALGMVEIVKEIGANRGIDLSVRIGIHSGPAVAGVIGTRKFTYDLWGEAVNLASRLESHGIPGRIQVSDAVRERLADDYLFEFRGEIEMKGVGPFRTWFLTGRKETTPQR